MRDKLIDLRYILLTMLLVSLLALIIYLLIDAQQADKLVSNQTIQSLEAKQDTLIDKIDSLEDQLADATTDKQTTAFSKPIQPAAQKPASRSANQQTRTPVAQRPIVQQPVVQQPLVPTAPQPETPPVVVEDPNADFIECANQAIDRVENIDTCATEHPTSPTATKITDNCEPNFEANCVIQYLAGDLRTAYLDLANSEYERLQREAEKIKQAESVNNDFINCWNTFRQNSQAVQCLWTWQNHSTLAQTIIQCWQDTQAGIKSDNERCHHQAVKNFIAAHLAPIRVEATFLPANWNNLTLKAMKSYATTSRYLTGWRALTDRDKNALNPFECAINKISAGNGDCVDRKYGQTVFNHKQHHLGSHTFEYVEPRVTTTPPTTGNNTAFLPANWGTLTTEQRIAHWAANKAAFDVAWAALSTAHKLALNPYGCIITQIRADNARCAGGSEGSIPFNP